MNFWQALHQLLSSIEHCLARWCVYELDPGRDALSLLFSLRKTDNITNIDPKALDGVSDARRQKALWGKWAGRENEFYEACARMVEPLKLSDVLALSGPDVRVYSRLTNEAYQELMSTTLPPALKVGAFRCDRATADSLVVNSYNVYDPIELPRSLVEVLPYFDGRPTQKAVEAISVERGIDISLDIISKLVDSRILVPSEQTSEI